MKQPDASADPKEPYCSNCGYQLTGLTESSKCPECGEPIVQVLVRGRAFVQMGKRYTSPTRIFGLPLIQVAFGPSPDELCGHAKGVIAIGDMATGFLAIGGFARGVIALGGLAIGLATLGGLSIGLMVAAGGGAIGGLACGGGAVGMVAKGGGAVGVIADGGGACGYIARGHEVRGRYTARPWPRGGYCDPEVAEWYWLIGPRTGSPVFFCWVAGAFAGVVLLSALIVALAYLTAGQRTAPIPDG